MDALAQFYAAHPFWTWIAAGAALLAIEVAVGSGYLLWAAASAGAVGLLALFGFRLGFAIELGLFAVLTMVSSLLAHRFFPARNHDGPDINDPNNRLVGKTGEAIGPFPSGQGRVFVEGKEWAAEAEGESPAAGDRVAVVGVADGASLKVRKL